MNQDKETPKQWAERVAKVFGNKQPSGIELRGGESGIHYNFDEVRLVDNYRRCKIEYKKLGLQDDHQAREHLEGQERLLYRFALGFNIDLETELSTPFGKHDFIPWPEYAESYYALGLADRIFVTEWHDIPYLLDFQYFNHVKAQKFDEVRFTQLLKNEVRHYVAQRGQVAERKLDYLNGWLYRHVSNLDADGKKRFFWYAEAFEWKGESTDARKASEQVTSESVGENSTNEAVRPVPILRRSILQYSCTKEELVEYFNVLKMAHPYKGEPMVNTEAVDWLLGYYFETSGRQTIENRPVFTVSMSKQELIFFIYRFTEEISPRMKGVKISPKSEVVRILTENFIEMFPNKPNSYITKLKQKAEESSNTATEMIDAAIERIKRRAKTPKSK